MLSFPNQEDVLNTAAGRLYSIDKRKYYRKAKAVYLKVIKKPSIEEINAELGNKIY